MASTYARHPEIVCLMLGVYKEPHVLKRVLLAVIASATLFHADGLAAQAQPPAPPPPEKIDYSDGKTWLCRPGRQDACAIDLTTTVVAAGRQADARDVDGRSEGADRLLLRLPDGLDRPDAQQRHERRSRRDSTSSRQQFARFASKCRPYAPLYRQVTLAGLRRMMAAGRAGARSRASATTTCATRGSTTWSTTTRDAASCWSATRRDRSSSPS